MLAGIELIEFLICEFLLFISILYFGVNGNMKNEKISNFEN